MKQFSAVQEDVRFKDRAEPTILAPTDAIIRIAATGVRGSDLWLPGLNSYSRPARWTRILRSQRCRCRWTGNSQSCSRAFLRPLEACERGENLHSLLHIHTS